ncbi:3'-5' exoribonuclease domain-containing protein [Lactococcus petauri]|uniref:3'-5' exoribonuclease domain-containing protein n=1 Tax=Lactococcus petauri TaxID=1940789 RepID=UPI00254EB29C|nr:3'-5' exoribonuclease [Lactococcus petauri]
MDIIVDLETLGTDVDSTVIQIAAAEFDITTGKLVGQPFNECVDLHYVPEIKSRKENFDIGKQRLLRI